MQTNWPELARHFDQKRDYVLACITRTEGATYQKAGCLMLIEASGRCHGLLSGGCLEADIALHAKKVRQSDELLHLSYDLRGDEALLWGLGAGCEGQVDIALVALSPKNNHLHFADLLNAVLQGKGACYALNLERAQAAIAATNLTCKGIDRGSDQSSDQSPSAQDAANQNLFEQTLSAFEKTLTWNKYIAIAAAPSKRILLAGAGPDVHVLIRMFLAMHWQVTVVDHRPAAIDALKQLGELDSALALENKVLEKEASEGLKQQIDAKLDKTVDPALIAAADALVIMTHNLQRDQQWLAASLDSELAYIGLLGPKARKQKLLKAIAADGDRDFASLMETSEQRVRGPIGLDLGGRGPEAIALSIVAELQRFFSASNSELKPCLKI
ncbi:XdhC family protein [Agaribacterium haliotis]|uniref:XdhC family protein n=1 Tax=Agaribacterium haliotis TaxID=2013869 RepID=UPI000BB5530B|nr:XdhC/CoxI family protein [Agaribacterium haliotis]